MKLSSVLSLVLVTVGIVVAAATGEAEGSCNAAYDADGNVVEGDCDATGTVGEGISGRNDGNDSIGDGKRSKKSNSRPDFSKYDCNDQHKECESWASQGECDANPSVS